MVVDVALLRFVATLDVVDTEAEHDGEVEDSLPEDVIVHYVVNVKGNVEVRRKPYPVHRLR